MTRDTHTYCRAFDSGAVTTCFNALGLSRLWFEDPTFRLQGKRSNRLHQRRGTEVLVLGHGHISHIEKMHYFFSKKSYTLQPGIDQKIWVCYDDQVMGLPKLSEEFVSLCII